MTTVPQQSRKATIVSQATLAFFEIPATRWSSKLPMTRTSVTLNSWCLCSGGTGHMAFFNRATFLVESIYRRSYKEMWEGFWLRNCKENMRFAKHERWNLENFVSLDLELISRVLQSYIGTSHCHLVENITSNMVCIQLLKLKRSVAAKPQRKPLYENTTYLKNTKVSIIWNSELEGYQFSADNFQDLILKFQLSVWK